MKRRNALLSQFFLVAAALFLLGGLYLIYWERQLLAGWYWATGLLLFFFLPRRWYAEGILPTLHDWWGMERAESIALLRTVLPASITFSLITHGFLFANEFFSHDSISPLTAQSSGSDRFYYTVGRFLIPFYEFTKGKTTAPWTVGLLFLLWMSLTCLLTVRLLKVRGRVQRILLCGVLCSSVSLSLTGATYIYCMDEYVLALFFSVLGAYLLCCRKNGALLGSFCVVLSLGLYQAYFTVALAMCYLVDLQDLLREEKLLRVVKRGFAQIASLACAFAVYYLIWKGICASTGLEIQRLGETALSKGPAELLHMVGQTCCDYWRYLTYESGSFFGPLLPMAILMLFAIFLFRVLVWLVRSPAAIAHKGLFLLLLALFPLAFNAAELLLIGTASYLTFYARSLLCLFPLLWEVPEIQQPRCYPAVRLQGLACLLLCLILWQNVVFANQIYMKKNLEKSATLSITTRMIERMEQTEGYIAGETQVVFVGNLNQNTYFNQGRNGFRELCLLPGLTADVSATYTSSVIIYFTNYLNYPLSILWDFTDYPNCARVQEMPAFPAQESIQMIDGVLVVKLS